MPPWRRGSPQLYAVTGTFGAGSVYFLVPKTKGKALKQIQAHWQAGRSSRELDWWGPCLQSNVPFFWHTCC